MGPRDLHTIETVLINGIANVRDKQHQQSLAVNGNMREMPQDYHQKDRDFTAQIPSGLHVQPMQPNLQENQ